MIFQVGLGILEHLEGEILNRSFDEIMLTIADIGKPAIQRAVFVRGFLQRTSKFGVSNRLLKSLAAEYHNLKVIASG